MSILINKIFQNPIITINFKSTKAKGLVGLGLFLFSAIPFLGSSTREKLAGDRFNAIKNSLGFREDLTGCKFESTLDKVDIYCPKANYTSESYPHFPMRETVQFTPDAIPSLVRYEGSLTNDQGGEGIYYYEDGLKGSVQWQKTEQSINTQQNGAHFFYEQESDLQLLRKYEGALVNGLMDGEGTLWDGFTNLEIYTGQWKEGKKEGQGKGIYKGKMIEGQWKDGKPYGNCTLFENGKPVYRGEINEEGEREGQGTELHPNGKDQYKGEWLKGLRHGRGVEFWDDGNYSGEGHWVKGEREGLGISHWKCIWSISKWQYSSSWKASIPVSDYNNYYNPDIFEALVLVRKDYQKLLEGASLS